MASNRAGLIPIHENALARGLYHIDTRLGAPKCAARGAHLAIANSYLGAHQFDCLHTSGHVVGETGCIELF